MGKRATRFVVIISLLRFLTTIQPLLLLLSWLANAVQSLGLPVQCLIEALEVLTGSAANLFRLFAKQNKFLL